MVEKTLFAIGALTALFGVIMVASILAKIWFICAFLLFTTSFVIEDREKV